MKTIPILICLLACFVFSATGQSRAQDASCSAIREEIIPLRVPNFSTPILWKKILGRPGPDMPADIVSLADGGFVLVGEGAPYDKDKGLGKNQLYLSRLDINGKQVWEKWADIPDLSRAAAAVAVKGRLAVLSETGEGGKTQAARIDFYDGAGNHKTSKIIADPKYNLIPQGMTAGKESQSLTIALWAVSRGDASDNFTILKTVATDGHDMASRQYLPGVANRLESFRKAEQGNVIGSGQITTGGIKAGWIFNADGDNGDLFFQRPYARGIFSNIRNIAQDKDGNLVVTGDAVPSGKGSRAAWIMKLDPSGNPLWEKYIQGKYGFSGRDISVLKDGRILALINARPNDANGGRDHVRLLTLTPNGQILGDEALIEGPNAQATNLLIRESSRIIAGVTQSGLADYSLAKNQKAASYDFWIVSLPKLAPFTDPCAARSAGDGFDDGF